MRTSTTRSATVSTDPCAMGREQRRPSTTHCAVTVDSCRNSTSNDVDGDQQRSDFAATPPYEALGLLVSFTVTPLRTAHTGSDEQDPLHLWIVDPRACSRIERKTCFSQTLTASYHSCCLINKTIAQNNSSSKTVNTGGGCGVQTWLAHDMTFEIQLVLIIPLRLVRRGRSLQDDRLENVCGLFLFMRRVLCTVGVIRCFHCNFREGETHFGWARWHQQRVSTFMVAEQMKAQVPKILRGFLVQERAANRIKFHAFATLDFGQGQTFFDD